MLVVVYLAVIAFLVARRRRSGLPPLAVAPNVARRTVARWARTRTVPSGGPGSRDASRTYFSASNAARAAVLSLKPAPWGMTQADRREREEVAVQALRALADAALAYADTLEAGSQRPSRGTSQ
jgi:hypothetical protein